MTMVISRTVKKLKINKRLQRQRPEELFHREIVNTETTSRKRGRYFKRFRDQRKALSYLNSNSVNTLSTRDNRNYLRTVYYRLLPLFYRLLIWKNDRKIILSVMGRYACALNIIHMHTGRHPIREWRAVSYSHLRLESIIDIQPPFCRGG